MLSNFDINHLFTFPFKDEKARNNFLMGTLIALAQAYKDGRDQLDPTKSIK